MGKLSTHVLDITQGKPGAGVKVKLFRVDGNTKVLLKTATTNQDGRCEQPLLSGGEVVAGKYELVFAAGDYFAAHAPIQYADTKLRHPETEAEVDRVIAALVLLRYRYADAMLARRAKLTPAEAPASIPVKLSEGEWQASPETRAKYGDDTLIVLSGGGRFKPA